MLLDTYGPYLSLRIQSQGNFAHLLHDLPKYTFRVRCSFARIVMHSGLREDPVVAARLIVAARPLCGHFALPAWTAILEKGQRPMKGIVAIEGRPGLWPLPSPNDSRC